MKVKTFIITGFLLTALGINIHAFGFGAQFNFSAAKVFSPGAALAISPKDGTNLAFNWYLGSEGTNTIGLTADMVPLTIQISSFNAGSFNFNFGVGLFSNFVFSDKFGFNAGLRLPLGFNVMLAKNVLEFYTHAAPSFGVRLLPSLGFSDFFVPVALGARIWLR